MTQEFSRRQITTHRLKTRREMEARCFTEVRIVMQCGRIRRRETLAWSKKATLEWWSPCLPLAGRQAPRASLSDPWATVLKKGEVMACLRRWLAELQTNSCREQETFKRVSTLELLRTQEKMSSTRCHLLRSIGESRLSCKKLKTLWMKSMKMLITSGGSSLPHESSHPLAMLTLITRGLSKVSMTAPKTRSKCKWINLTSLEKVTKQSG